MGYGSWEVEDTREVAGKVGRVGFRNGGKKGGRRGRLRDLVVDDGS